MLNDLNGIPVFIAVVESGNFSKAAQKLFLTRSAIGKTISRLEERLGVDLFKRTTRSQTLTEEGWIFYQQSRLALDSIRKAEDEIQQGKMRVKGHLKVSLPVLFGHKCVMPILFALAQTYPELKLELAFSDQQVNLLEEGVDLAVRIGTLTDSLFIKARQLGQHGMVLCASPYFLSKYFEPFTLAELSNCPAIGYKREGIIQNWQLKDDIGNIVDFCPKTVLSTDDFTAIAAAACNGIGVAWLPDWLVSKEIELGQLRQILPNSACTSFAINLIWPNSTWLPYKTRVVIDELVAKLPEPIT